MVWHFTDSYFQVKRELYLTLAEYTVHIFERVTDLDRPLEVLHCAESKRVMDAFDGAFKAHICSQKYGAIVIAIQLWPWTGGGWLAAVTLTIVWQMTVKYMV